MAFTVNINIRNHINEVLMEAEQIGLFLKSYLSAWGYRCPDSFMTDDFAENLSKVVGPGCELRCEVPHGVVITLRPEGTSKAGRGERDE